MEIRIPCYGESLTTCLFGMPCPERGFTLWLSADVSVSYERTDTARGVEFGDVLVLIASVPTSVAASVFAKWLTDKLRSTKVTRIEIERTEIHLEQGTIVKVISEKLKRNDSRV